MAAPPAARPGLMALYAFNLEIARAPWVASEPGLAAIRLRWWHDAVAEIYDGQAARRHEVVEPLAEAIRAGDLPRRLFEEMIAARLADAEAGAHAGPRGAGALHRPYRGASDGAGGAASRRRGRGAAGGAGFRPRGGDGGAAARAAGAAGPAGAIRCRTGWRSRRWRGTGWRRWRGRGARRDRVPAAAAPALLAGWQAGRVLKRAAADPGRAAGGGGGPGRGRGCCGARSAGAGRLKRRCRRS